MDELMKQNKGSKNKKQNHNTVQLQVPKSSQNRKLN